MTRNRTILGAVLACLTLAACGVDGPPTPPEPRGVTVSGTVEVGVVGGS